MTPRRAPRGDGRTHESREPARGRPTAPGHAGVTLQRQSGRRGPAARQTRTRGPRRRPGGRPAQCQKRRLARRRGPCGQLGLLQARRLVPHSSWAWTADSGSSKRAPTVGPMMIEVGARRLISARLAARLAAGQPILGSAVSVLGGARICHLWLWAAAGGGMSKGRPGKHRRRRDGQSGLLKDANRSVKTTTTAMRDVCAKGAVLQRRWTWPG